MNCDIKNENGRLQRYKKKINKINNVPSNQIELPGHCTQYEKYDGPQVSSERKVC
jgi:hypothetical protein